MNKARSAVALICVYLTLNLLGCGSSPEQKSRDIAAQIIARANQIKAQAKPAPEDLNQLASQIESYVAAAKKDGSLSKAEHSLRQTLVQPRLALEATKVATARQALQQRGLEATLMQSAADLRKIGTGLQQAKLRRQGPSLTYVSTHLTRAAFFPEYECQTLEGGFLATLAIGALASLGGVNPLGDLLAAIGAVGEFGTYIACHTW